MEHHTSKRTYKQSAAARFILLAVVLGAVLLTATPSPAQTGSYGVITTGTAQFGSSRYTYAAITNFSSWPGFYLRVWMGGNRVMIIGPGEVNGNIMSMNYTIYNTMGQHWTLGRGGADRTRWWRPETAGVFAMDVNSIPGGTVGILSGSMTGRGRQTYRAHSAGAGTKWYGVRANWWGAGFYPGRFDAGLLRQLQQWQQAALNQRRRPQTPPKKKLTNVTVNKHNVTVRVWDHSKQDGDIVEIYLDGRLLRRVTLTNGGASINLQLSRGSHRFEVRALNQGSVGPNTAALSITGVVKGNPRQSWSLTTGQTTGMYITVAP